jgi:puromycin-sensitive aminopeptidase
MSSTETASNSAIESNSIIASNPFRIPRTVTPSRYDITLSPDLRQRDFVGRVTVTVMVHEPTNLIICNAAELNVAKAWVTTPDRTRTDAVEITHDAEAERVTLRTERTIPAGPASVVYEFTGTLNDKLAGFYASTYNDDAGVEHIIAATQFEATDARKAFPCWDEPDLKAVFGVTLVVANGLTAISNAPVLRESTLSSGKRSVTFEDTMLMSTYLLCFVVGELEISDPVDVDGIPLRIVHRPGRSHLTAFAKEIGAFSLRYFAQYYDIAYPGKKMDFIALPDFAAGAMENVGAVTFRETLVLIDPEQASHLELERVADVIAHEVAHMWFGDLVTMSWWNGLWLNEAFATYAELSCIAAFRPEWNRWTSFGVSRSAAMGTDGLHATRPIEFPVISPADADGMFDVLTYEKGASILRMLEQYLGEEVFRDGVRHYLRTHAYGNTETTDLFESLELISGEPVAELMNGWIFSGGFPLISATATATGIDVQQKQFNFLPDGPGQSWMVPIMWRNESPAAELAAELAEGLASEGRVLLREESMSTGAPADATIVVNAGGHGFYRVRYDDELSARLLPKMQDLAAIERFGMVSDTWAGVMSGSLPAQRFLQLATASAAERDPNVWAALLEGLNALDQIADEGAREPLRTLVRSVAGPILTELGWQPVEGESAQQAQLRGRMVSALGILGADVDIRRQAAELLDDALAGTLQADVSSAVVSVAARTGNAALWERYEAARLATSNPQEAIRLLHALGSFEDPALRARTLAHMLSDAVRSQDAPFVIIRMLMDRMSGPEAWAWLQTNWDTFIARIPANTVGRILDGLVQRSEPGLPEQIRTFFAAHPIPQAGKQVTQKLELVNVYEQLRAREAAGLTAALASLHEA